MAVVKHCQYYLFDENRNPDLQSKQLDVHLCYLDVNGIDMFLGHASVRHIIEKIQPLIEELVS